MQLMLAFVDVDGLKQLNDTRGHPAGDAALRLVGQALRANLRPYDVIVRYGGDEFLCAMPNLSAPEARARFKRIAHALAAVNAEHSISFGLAQAQDSEILRPADRPRRRRPHRNTRTRAARLIHPADRYRAADGRAARPDRPARAGRGHGGREARPRRRLRQRTPDRRAGAGGSGRDRRRLQSRSSLLGHVRVPARPPSSWSCSRPTSTRRSRSSMAHSTAS